MEPVQRARQGGEYLRHAVETRDVRELVQQDGTPPIDIPRVSDRRQHHSHRADADGHRYRLITTAQQAYGPAYSHSMRGFGQRMLPAFVPQLETEPSQRSDGE